MSRTARLFRKRALMALGAFLLIGAGGALILWTNPLLMVRVLVAVRPRPLPSQPITWDPGPAEAKAAPDDRPPNIIVILADDLGFNDLTVNGGGVADGAVPTPNIDAIAKQGVTLTQGYAGDATCAPSRAAIMTGRYATRFGFEFTPTPVTFSKLVGTFRTPGTAHAPIFHAERLADMPPADWIGVPRAEVMAPELLRQAGYHTLMFGKWHLGEGAAMTPHRRGFDEFVGFLSGASLYLPKGDPRGEISTQDFDPIDQFLWAALPFSVSYNDGPLFTPPTYMTDYLGDEAVRAIEANRNRPFFLYLAFNAPHTPLQALKADYDALPQIADHRLRVYAAMIRALDRNVGKITRALADHGLDRNTMVVFTSDNGGAHYIGLPDINRPYRGWKATFFEGGIHVPFFIKWPARLAAGARYDQPVGHVDIFATAAAAAGATPGPDKPLDGVDLVPYLTGARSERPHQTLFWRSGDYKVLMDGDWKLQVSAVPDRTWLFNLREDPTERRDLAASDPERVAALRARLAEVDGAQAKPIWPALLEGAIAIDHPLGVPDKPGDDYIYWAN